MRMAWREIAGWTRSRKLLASVAVALTLGIGILIGTVISGRVSATHSIFSLGTSPLAMPDPVQLSTTFAGIVNKVEPAVVNISTTQVLERGKSHGHGGGDGDDDDDGGQGQGGDPFQNFFNRFFDSPDPGEQAERSLGSGVIVDKKGYILTNNHVIDQATKIQVQLDDDQTLYTAKVVGIDKDTDLAVIKIDAGRDLPTAQLGNSDGVQVGDWVLAIGSPFGLQATVTAGIISAKDRSNIGGQFQRFIQTDAAINPGNSGGPLVSLAGQVVGINTAIITGSHGYEGVGFAMPSSTAIGVYNQIVATGHVTRGSIGVMFTDGQSNNPIVLRDLGAPYGIVLQSVTPGSPADKAGLKAGDVITAVNGQPVRSGNDLVNPIAATPVGNKVSIDYVRDKSSHDTSVVVADRTKIVPDDDSASDADSGTSPSAAPEETPTLFGLHLEELTPDRAKRLEYSGQHGVLVTGVDPATFGEDLEFERGDIIAEINHKPINSIADYESATESLKPGQDILFKVIRHGDNGDLLTVLLAGSVPAPGQ
ncbi:MAG: Do family serine endopeptidase [Candidatus Acidiferrales bacterium]